MTSIMLHFFFFFNDTATTEIYTLSLHDALPIFCSLTAWTYSWNTICCAGVGQTTRANQRRWAAFQFARDRKSTRLNSSHGYISYAVFCLKKKDLVVPALRWLYDYASLVGFFVDD